VQKKKLESQSEEDQGRKLAYHERESKRILCAKVGRERAGRLKGKKGCEKEREDGEEFGNPGGLR